MNPEIEKITREVTFDIFKKMGANVVEAEPQLKGLDSWNLFIKLWSILIAVGINNDERFKKLSEE